MDIGVFLPIGNNGWLISETAPQYLPSFDLNRAIVEKAERYGFEFALSMIKLRGFGGKTEFWDHNLESFTLMAGLAAVSTRIQLFASVATLTIPPAIIARMAATIDSIAPGRFGVNIVSGWQKAEYDQMGMWPGEGHFARRYDVCGEYVRVMKDLWETGHSDFRGEFYQMADCRLSPRPRAPVKLIAAGQSARGMEFAAACTDYNFVSGTGINTPASIRPHAERLAAVTARTGSPCRALSLMMIIAEETDEAALAKWEHYKAGTDLEALAWRDAQAAEDRKAAVDSTVGRFIHEGEKQPTTMLRLIGSYATVARLLDECAAIEGLAGVMLTFDDFLEGMDKFGTRIQPLMQSRARVMESL
jgi:pyrimidine oxygenase